MIYDILIAAFLIIVLLLFRSCWLDTTDENAIAYIIQLLTFYPVVVAGNWSLAVLGRRRSMQISTKNVCYVVSYT
jgi:hypothetical protein